MSLGRGLARMLAARTDQERREGAKEFTASQEALRRDVEAAGGKIRFNQTGEQLARRLKRQQK